VSAIPSLGSVLSSPVVRDGVVYFGSTDGYVYALQ
jgi:outer membrane protein assembly factor BamB